MRPTPCLTTFAFFAVTSCAADMPVTTPAAPTTPTPQNTTTPVAPTTAAPSPPLPKPPTGNYNVTTAEVNGTICLMATLGLRVAFMDGEVLFTRAHFRRRPFASPVIAGIALLFCCCCYYSFSRNYKRLIWRTTVQLPQGFVVSTAAVSWC